MKTKSLKERVDELERKMRKKEVEEEYNEFLDVYKDFIIEKGIDNEFTVLNVERSWSHSWFTTSFYIEKHKFDLVEGTHTKKVIYHFDERRAKKIYNILKHEVGFFSWLPSLAVYLLLFLLMVIGVVSGLG